jgi:ABC-type Zn uptake system ZnuABC Zn-binding protein ZnuA
MPSRRRHLIWVAAACAWVAAQAAHAAAPAPAAAPLSIVATTSDLASLARELTAGSAEVTCLAPPTQNAENYEPRPRDLDAVRHASLVIRVGLDFDLWLDRLVAQTGNPNLRRGGAGYVDTSRGIAVLDLRAQGLGPATGHAHGSGNPHYWLDPSNVEVITGNMVEALELIDPARAGIYRSRRVELLKKIATLLEGWKRELSSLQGARVVAYHNTWPYFARRFRLNIVGLIEPREGIPPSPAHLAGLVRQMKDEQVALILSEPWAPPELTALLAGRTGARVVVLAPSVGALPGTGTYADLIRSNVDALRAANRQ